MSRWIWLALIGVLTSSYLNASDAPGEQETIKKLEQAISQTNIFDLASFQMTATVQILSKGGKPLDGEYRLLWNGPEQWREEINLPGYSEVQVGGKDMVWNQRSLDFIPLRIAQLHSTLGFGTIASSSAGFGKSFVHLGFTSKDRVKKSFFRNWHGDKLACIEVENVRKFSSEVCVNDKTGTLFRGGALEDHDFQPVGNKLFPRSLGFTEDGKSVVKINVSNITVPGEFSLDTFAPLPGVSGEAGCMNPMPYRRIKDELHNPQEVEQPPGPGVVVVDKWIGTNGIPRIRKVVPGSSASLEKFVIKMVSWERFEPATCNGKPVQVETVMRVVMR